MKGQLYTDVIQICCYKYIQFFVRVRFIQFVLRGECLLVAKFLEKNKPFALTACQGIAHKFIGSGTDRGYPIACLICFFISFWRCCPCFVRLSVFLSVHDINHETNIVMTCIHPDNTYSKLYSTKQERQAGIHVRQGQREESNSQHNYKTPNERVYDRQRIN